MRCGITSRARKHSLPAASGKPPPDPSAAAETRRFHAAVKALGEPVETRYPKLNKLRAAISQTKLRIAFQEAVVPGEAELPIQEYDPEKDDGKITRRIWQKRPELRMGAVEESAHSLQGRGE